MGERSHITEVIKDDTPKSKETLAKALCGELGHLGSILAGNLAALVAQMVKNLPAMQETLPHLNPGSGSSPGGGNGNPLQYSCLENSMDRGAWWATVHRVAKSQDMTERLTFHFLFPPWDSILEPGPQTGVEPCSYQHIFARPRNLCVSGVSRFSYGLPRADLPTTVGVGSGRGWRPCLPWGGDPGPRQPTGWDSPLHSACFFRTVRSLWLLARGPQGVLEDTRAEPAVDHGDSREAWMNRRRPETHPVTEQAPQVGPEGKALPTLQIGKLRLIEVKWPPRDHTLEKWAEPEFQPAVVDVLKLAAPQPFAPYPNPPPQVEFGVWGEETKWTPTMG